MDLLREIGLDNFPRHQLNREGHIGEVHVLLKESIELDDCSRALEVARFVRTACWDQLNIGIYSEIKPHWRQVTLT